MTDKFGRDLLSVLGRIARALEKIAMELNDREAGEDNVYPDDSED